MSRKVSVLGLGRWGTTLAWYLGEKNYNVTIWGRNERKVKDFLTHRRNEYVKLSNKINITNNLKEAVDNSDYLVITILSQGMRELCSKLSKYNLKNKTIVLATKGLEEKSCLTMSQVIEEELGKVNVGVLVGPAFTEILTKGRKSYLVASSSNHEIARTIAEIFSSEFVKVDVTDDIIGVQLCSAAKNVISLLVGICHNGEYGNLMAGLLNYSLSEIEELGRKMGARSETFRGLTFLADLFLTCLNPYSRNKKFGELLSKGKKLKDISFSAEGVTSAKVLHQLTQKFKVDMPIFEAVYEIVFLNKSCKDEIEKLWDIYPKAEN